MPLHAQKKGKSGEVEFCKWLLENFGIETERVYNQADGVSSDIVIADFIFEIKRREVLDLDSWWWQVTTAQQARIKKKNQDLIPIVAYRQNRKPWNFLMPAKLIHGCELGYVIAPERVFKQFARGIIK